MVQPYPQYPPQQPQQWTTPYRPAYQPPRGGGGGGGAEAPKEISLALLIAAGIVVWIFIMGGALGYVAVAPCGFLKTVVGNDNLVKLQDQGNLGSPCTFESGKFSCEGACSAKPASKCKVWKLDANEGCTQFIIEATTK